MRDAFDFSRELEGNIEDEVVAWAENHGWEVRKVQYIGRRGCADRIFFGYGRILMIEFKRPKGERSEGQVQEHKRLAKVGVTIPVIDNVAEAKAYLKRFVR